jgi:outer membrane receptor protein involved in Fe transport
VWRASASYVTGAHQLKAGHQAAYQIEKQHHYSVDSGIQQYLFFDGFPISLTQRISPHMHSNRTRFDAFYVQDQWTRNRLTLQAALRYEHAWSWFPEGERHYRTVALQRGTDPVPQHGRRERLP